MRRTAELGCSLGREAGASLIATELYPLGMLTGIPTLPLPWKDQAHDGTAVLFLHGFFHNRSAFGLMKNRLAWSGLRHFYDLNLYTTLKSVPRLAEQVSRTVEKIYRSRKIKQVVIVAHSMGGIIARTYLQKQKRDGEISHLITLGTAHQGTYLSRLSPLPHLKELAPGSDLLLELNSLPAPQATHALNLFGSHDLILKPKTAALWKGIDNLELAGLGHLGILFSRRAAKNIIGHLTPPPEKKRKFA